MASLWERFQKYFLQYDDLDFSIDISRMRFADDFFTKMQPRIDRAFAAMSELEKGALANPDEQRMVGHYWLRNPQLAPNAQLRADIEQTNARIKDFAAQVHRGTIVADEQNKFAHLLLIGIGGSALGPQFIADALGNPRDPMDIYFFDNTDPDGFDRVFQKIGHELARTLIVVISKSGGTKETRNGMLEAKVHFQNAGLELAKHAVAVSWAGGGNEKERKKDRLLGRLPVAHWGRGRASVVSAAGGVA